MNISKTALLASGLAILIHGSTVFAASTKDEVIALKEEVAALKAGQETMQSDLAEIKKLLEEGAKAAPTPPKPKPFEPRDVSIAGAPVIGDPKATITMIGYSDYQCPFCARHAKQTVPDLVKNYIDQGKLKLVMREFPIASIHPRATPASQAALCAGAQGKYWEMHDLLFDNPRNLSDEDFKNHGEALQLNIDEFTFCVEQGSFTEQIQKDLEEGKEMGVRGTPSFVLGYTDSGDPNNVRVTKFVRGARGYDSFAQEIDELLNAEEQSGDEAGP